METSTTTAAVPVLTSAGYPYSLGISPEWKHIDIGIWKKCVALSLLARDIGVMATKHKLFIIK